MSNKVKVQPGQLYAVSQGTYKGSNLVIIKHNETTVEFLDLPEMKPMSIPLTEVEHGIDNKILELLDSLPCDIIEVCTKQYEKNIINR